jgi:hypothetical protein
LFYVFLLFLFFPRTFFPILFACTFFPYNFHRTFPVLPPPVPFFPYFFVLFSPYCLSPTFSLSFFSRYFYFPFFFSLLFSRIFFPSSFLSSSTKCWLGVFSTMSAYHKTLPPLLFSYIRCSLRRPRPITIENDPYFHILGVLYDVSVLYPSTS